MFNFMTILEALSNVGVALLLFCIFWLSNFCLSLYYNIGVLKERFDKAKLILGLQKLLAVFLGLLFLVVGLTLMPEFMKYVGFGIKDEWIELFDKVGILSIIITSCLTYGKEAIETLRRIFTNIE